MGATGRSQPCIHLGPLRCKRTLNDGSAFAIYNCHHPEHNEATAEACATCPSYVPAPDEDTLSPPPVVSAPHMLKMAGVPQANNAQPTYEPETEGLTKGEYRRWRRSQKKNRPVIGRWIQEADPSPVTDRCGRPGGMAGLYYGADLYLVLGGPSVRSLDLSLLDQRGVVSMAVNNAALTYRTDLFICGDPPRKFHDAIWRDPGVICFCPKPKMWEVLYERRSTGRIGSANTQVKYQPAVVGYDRNTQFNPETFLSEPSVSFGNSKKWGNEWPSVLSTFFSALKMAWWLGFFRVYLLGCDWEWDYKQDPYHFSMTRPPNVYRSNNHSYSKMVPMLEALKPVFDTASFEVYNCNPESKLMTFPHIPFEQAVKETNKAIPTNLDGSDWYGKDALIKDSESST